MKILIAAGTLVLALAATGAALATRADREHGAYTVTRLVSDQPGVAATTDANLVNSWGITASPSSPWWVANNGTKTSTLYNGAGQPFPTPPADPLIVNVAGAPTGTVFNGGKQFIVSAGGKSGPALFLFATESGAILGWSPVVDRANAVEGVVSPGAVYKGLAIAGDTLYATDFHNGRVDVFDGSFHVVSAPGAFTDQKLPRDFAPFGIQNLGGNIFVTYAKQSPGSDDEVDGPRLGFVDEFDATGNLLQRVAERGRLNAPWGLAMAPASFGRAGGDLLVGNFGDGRINAFSLKHNGRFEPDGQLRGTGHQPLTIDGLWGIGFGNGANSGPIDSLYFAAGPDDENHGLFGVIQANQPGTGDDQANQPGTGDDQASDDQ
jgi:uncharacterized protein (TIGR03118 family)